MKRHRLSILVIFVAVLFVFYPAMTFDFAFSDDFHFFRDARNYRQTMNWLNMDGRFFFNIWVMGIFGQVTPLWGFKFVRILSVAGVFSSAVVFYTLLRRWLVRDRVWATAAACAFAVNPGMLFLASWVCAGMWTWAVFFALLAASVLLGVPKESPAEWPATGEDFDWRAALRRSPWAALCLFFALGTYQPAAMSFWIGGMIWLAGAFDFSKPAWRKLFVVLGVFAVTAIVYFLVCKLFVVGNSERFVVKVQPHRRLAWFVVHPLRVALGYPALKPFYLASAGVAIFLAVGLYRYARRRQRPLALLPMLGAALPLALLPMMVAAQRYDVSRIRQPLYGMGIVLWCVALLAFARDRKSFHLCRNVAIFGALLGIGIGQHHLLHYFIVPQVVEQSYIQTQLAEYIRLSPDLKMPIHLIAPPKSDDFAGCFVNDEWGMASSSQFWSAEAMPRLLLASMLHRDIGEMQGFPFTLGPEQPKPESAFLIDLQQLKLAR